MLLFLKNLLFTVFVPGAVAVYVPLRLAGGCGGLPPVWGVAQYAALLPLACGCAVYFCCLWDFAAFGRGTPAPVDAPRRLVVRGLYRYVRNPMYVGILSILLGEALLFASQRLFAYTAVAFIFYFLVVVFYEEPTLRRKFGESYRRYCKSVPRWIPWKMKTYKG